MDNLRQIGQAACLYMEDHDSFIPSAYTCGAAPQGWAGYIVLGKYLGVDVNNTRFPDVFWCPACPEKPTTMGDVKYMMCNYFGYMGDPGRGGTHFRKITEITQPENTVFICDGTKAAGMQKGENLCVDRVDYRHNGFANCLFFDGHVEPKKGLGYYDFKWDKVEWE